MNGLMAPQCPENGFCVDELDGVCQLSRLV